MSNITSTRTVTRNYFKQTEALTNARKEDVYKYEKAENLERRFWCQLHQDFYSSVVMRKGKAPIVSCKFVDWAYFEKMNDPFFNQSIAKCKEFGLYDIMGFWYDWNEEILAQFHSSLYYDARQVAFFWTTEGVKYGVDYMTFSRLFGLGLEDEKRDPIHVEHQLKPSQLPALFYNPILAEAGNASTLQPFYYTMNQFFRATIDAKDGDATALIYFACNLLARVMPGGRPFCIMDFIWNELRRTMNDPQKFLPSAPYIMYMIERVTKVTFPKDCKHAALHLRPRSGDAPHAPPLHAGATRNPRFHPAPSYSGPSSSRRGHHDSFIKRALKSIFCMCKTATQEINENRRDIIEIKSHLGFRRIHTMSSPSLMTHLPNGMLRMRPPLLLLMLLFLSHISAPVPLLDLVALLLVAKRFLMKRKRPKKKHPPTTARSPTRMRMRIPPMRMPKMMMSRRPSCHFSFPFWHLMTKGE
jgi:hypothetical protein